MDLNDLFYFVRVVDHGGYSAAARVLNLPKSRLSRRVVRLEEELATRLLNRSSRRMALTDAGRALYQHGRAMLVEADAAEAAVRVRQEQPTGVVRLACSIGVSQFVMSRLLPAFLSAYPGVQATLHASNHYVDAIGEGLDLVLRAHTGPLPDSSLVQRKVATTHWILVASPSYLSETGRPESPADLKNHRGLKLGSGAPEGNWHLRRLTRDEGSDVAVPFVARFCSDDMTALKRAAEAGLGILALPGYICRPEIESGSLEPVLPEWSAGHAQFSLLMPSRRGQMPAVRALADYLAAEMPDMVQSPGNKAFRRSVDQ